MNAAPEIEAVRDALKGYLEEQLGDQFPECEFLSSWPSGPNLPAQAVVILATGEASAAMHNPRVVRTEANAANDTVVTYAYGYLDGVPLSIDCWATTDGVRNDLQLAMRRALNRPPSDTIAGAAPAAMGTFRQRAFLTLAVDALFGALFTFRFTAVPTIDESSEGAEKNEWRSSWRGNADGPMWDQDTFPAMKRINIRGNIGPGKLGQAAGNQPLNETRPDASLVMVVVSPGSAEIRIGATQPLTATSIAADGTRTDVTALATWSTTNSAVATVAAGLVTVAGGGTAQISASFGGHTGTMSVSAH